jgi:hypothetical protein
MIHQEPHPTSRGTPAANNPTARALAWEKQFKSIDAFVAHAQKSARLEPVVYELNRGSLRKE